MAGGLNGGPAVAAASGMAFAALSFDVCGSVRPFAHTKSC